ncbi:hypothetical protein [Roseobacter sinensis]|uniref:Uncharacterized protein n=1 Tax=Roseobacter sinensis TaxID=2931391 RepID=A0ABT3BGN3_9RHOB|nr:hypothetical protein [Roseobacter sp. WL0113]MCV3272737.1 hypothetical protein [Roseobacter sp. WL0113]
MLVRKIIFMMSRAMAMAVVMGLAVTVWTQHKNSERASNDRVLMVQGGFDALTSNIEALNYD